MATQSLPTKISWAKKAFERTTQFTHDGQVVGEIKRDGIFGHDVTARLYNTHVRFDVMGFVVHSVNIHDLTNNDKVVGRIELNFGKRATLTLKNGEVYVWKRANFLMKEWHLIHDIPNTDNDPEVIDYERTRRLFFAEEGKINILKPSPNEALLVLTGLFIRNYFLRRRRIAAGATS